MIDDKTPHQQLPLPHAKNLLNEDVERLRQSLNQIDALIYTAQQQAEQLSQQLNHLEQQQQQQTHQQQQALQSLHTQLEHTRLLALCSI